MDLMQIVFIIVLCVAVGYFYPRIPAPWNWALAALVVLIALLGLAKILGIATFIH